MLPVQQCFKDLLLLKAIRKVTHIVLYCLHPQHSSPVLCSLPASNNFQKCHASKQQQIWSWEVLDRVFTMSCSHSPSLAPILYFYLLHTCWTHTQQQFRCFTTGIHTTLWTWSIAHRQSVLATSLATACWTIPTRSLILRTLSTSLVHTISAMCALRPLLAGTPLLWTAF
jgi:hypothetical protein